MAMAHTRQRYRYLAFCLLTLALCTNDIALAAPATTGEQQLLEQARSHFQQAKQADAPQRQELQLRAIAILIQAGYTLQAKNTLSEIDTRGLPDLLIYRKQLLHAELALLEQSPDAAILALTRIPASAPGEITSRRLLSLVRAYEIKGEFYNALQTRLALNNHSADPVSAKENQRAITKLFYQLDAHLAKQRQDASSNKEQLGKLHDQLRQQMREWTHTHPDEIQTLAPSAINRRIAVLLPLSGRYAAASNAIKAGIESANQSLGSPDHTLLFYDTKEEDNHITQVYQQAVLQGADVIIGPLTKDAVNSLVNDTSINIPTLALNHLAPGSYTPGKLYQFSLSPEDEAEQVARKAWDDGHHRAIIYSPSGSLGERVSTAFRAAWIKLGGSITTEQTYPADKTDQSSLIQDSLLLTQSTRRMQTLERSLGQSLEFIPRVRNDADFIFLIANPRQARNWRPQLVFHYAGKLPVYSTSNVYSGIPNEKDDRDAEGIIFADMPWVLERSDGAHPLRNQLINEDDQTTRLVAFGIDAFRLAIELSATTTPPVLLDGETGKLSLRADRRIERTMNWARFQNGTPQPYSGQIENKDDDNQSND